MVFGVSRGRAFQGTTIGLAPLKAMCSDYQSGAVNTVRKSNQSEILNDSERSAALTYAKFLPNGSRV